MWFTNLTALNNVGQNNPINIATFSLIVPAFLVWRQKRDQSILDTNNRIKKSREINKFTNLLIIY